MLRNAIDVAGSCQGRLWQSTGTGSYAIASGALSSNLKAGPLIVFSLTVAIFAGLFERDIVRAMVARRYAYLPATLAFAIPYALYMLLVGQVAEFRSFLPFMPLLILIIMLSQDGRSAV